VDKPLKFRIELAPLIYGFIDARPPNDFFALSDRQQLVFARQLSDFVV
jgi:hypothetical protein